MKQQEHSESATAFKKQLASYKQLIDQDIEEYSKQQEKESLQDLE